MKIFLDTNILLDVLLKRDPFYADSLEVLKLCEDQKYEAWISIVSVANVFYIGNKFVGKHESLRVIEILMQYLNVASGSTELVKMAIESKFSDFEDALQNATATKTKGIKAIITRNVKDFRNSQLPAFTPLEFLKSGL